MKQEQQQQQQQSGKQRMFVCRSVSSFVLLLCFCFTTTRRTTNAFQQPSLITTKRTAATIIKQAQRRKNLLLIDSNYYKSKNDFSLLSATTSPIMAAAAPPVYYSSSSWQSILYMTLLAMQFGSQPLLVQTFISSSIRRSSIVFAQEIVKILLSTLALYLSGSWKQSFANWSIISWLWVAGLPATLYIVQNYCSLVAYQTLPAVTFNVLNQTKTLSAALWCYFILGTIQSKLQICSLGILLLAALILQNIISIPTSWTTTTTTTTTSTSSPTSTTMSSTTTTTRQDDKEIKTKNDEPNMNYNMGVISILISSLVSGLAGALIQKSMQHLGRDAYLLSMELASFSLLFMLFILLWKTLFTTTVNKPTATTTQIILDNKKSWWHAWTWKTWIPVSVNAAGGILVGLVTQHAGAVKKGFALIFGLCLSGILQATISTRTNVGKTTATKEEEKEGRSISSEQVIGASLAALSVWMHSRFPATTAVQTK